MRISDWSSDVCSSDLSSKPFRAKARRPAVRQSSVASRVAISGPDGKPTEPQRSANSAIPISWASKALVAAVSVPPTHWQRSEEHTSELQSLMRISYAVFCLKKKKNIKKQQYTE